MNEYVCLTILANPGEPEPAFKTRLVAFWTHMLRNRPDDYERVYAETTLFSRTQDRVSRQYMVELGVADTLAAELTSAGIAFTPIDLDDTYSKYEAASPEWFVIEH